MLEGVLETIVIPVALRVLVAALVLLVGRWFARRSRAWIEKSLRRTDLSESFITLIVTTCYYGIVLIVVVVALGFLGVPTTTLVGAVGIIIIVLAIALQTSLGNLAATVIIMLFKPFQTGDVIQTGGVLGGVQEIQMLSTVLASADGKIHIVPNGVIQATGLTNLSKTGRLRVDLSFLVSYGSDVDRAKEILTNVLAADERVLAEPPARVFVQQLADNGIVLAAWPLVKTQDFGTFQTDLAERVKHAFDAAGIDIPRPQQDVYLFSQG